MRTALILPLVRAILAVFWIGTGVVGLASLLQAAEQLGLAGVGPGAARLAVQVTAVVGIALGLLVCVRRTARWALWGMAVLSLLYIASGALWRRDLWLDPLGPLLKMLPVGALALTALAMLQEPDREP